MKYYASLFGWLALLAGIILLVTCDLSGCDSGVNIDENKNDAGRPGSWIDPDGDTDDQGNETAEYNVCGIEIRFDFGHQDVEFRSNNDSTTYVIVYHTNDEGYRESPLIDNILFPNGDDLENATFEHGDFIEIEVFAAPIDLLGELMEQLFDGEFPDRDDLLCSRVYSEL